MVSHSDFRPERILASGIFFGQELNPERAFRQGIQELSAEYDGNMVSLPLPPDLPPEVPAVILTSRDGSRQIEFSRARVNIAWMFRNGGARPDLGHILVGGAERLSEIAERNEVTIGRVGAVAVWRTTLARPGRALAEHFCRQQWLMAPLNRPEGFELHAHKTYELRPDIRVNSWVRVKTAKAGSGDFDHIIVEQDINTLTEEMDTHQYSRDQMVPFFEAAAVEFPAILELYFPAEGESSGTTGTQ